MQVAATEILGRDHFAGGRLHQRRSAEKDGALVADDHGLVAHRRDVGAARRARSQHRGDLRDALRAEIGLVVEDPAEVIAVGEHLVLARQERAAGVDQIDARQPVLRRDLLRAQVLLDRNRVVGTTFDRRIVGDDHAFAAGDPADAGDDPGAGTLVVVHAVGGQRRDLEQWTAGIEQPVDAVARQQLAAVDVPGAGSFRTAQRSGRELAAQLLDKRGVRDAVLRR